MILVLALLTTFARAASNDPLFSRMEGEWSAKGTRIEAATGAKITITSQVTTTVSADSKKLTSRNVVHEDWADGRSRDYTNLYWLAPTEGKPGSYDLLLSTSGKPAAVGTFDGRRLEILQEYGTVPPVRVESITDFAEPGHTEYRERVLEQRKGAWILKTETQVTFTRKI